MKTFLVEAVRVVEQKTTVQVEAETKEKAVELVEDGVENLFNPILLDDEVLIDCPAVKVVEEY